MSGAPGADIGVAIGLRPRSQTRVTLSVSRAEGCAYLVIGDDVAEIRLDRPHLTAILAQAPECIAGLDRADTNAATQDRAERAMHQALTIEQRLRQLANSAECVGNSEKSEKLHAVAQRIQLAARAADDALNALIDANAELDRINERGQILASQPGVGDDGA